MTKTQEKTAITEITIKDKVYPLHFGLDFINEMDKRYSIESSIGLKFGAGMQSVLYYLEQWNPSVLIEIILAATHTQKSIPSRVDIETWLEEQDLEELFERFLLALKKAPMTGIQIKRLYQNLNSTQ